MFPGAFSLDRLVVALALPMFAAACGSSAAPAPASSSRDVPSPAPSMPRPSADASLGACGQKLDLAWLEESTWLRIAESSHGHFGRMEKHLDLERLYGAERFTGYLTLTYEVPHRLPVVETKPIDMARDRVVALLTTLRHGARAEREPARSQHVTISDSSRSGIISVVAMRRKDGVVDHVEFAVDDAETTPSRWHLRSNATVFPSSAQEASSVAYQELFATVEYAAFEDAVRKRAQAAPKRTP